MAEEEAARWKRILSHPETERERAFVRWIRTTAGADFSRLKAFEAGWEAAIDRAIERVEHNSGSPFLTADQEAVLRGMAESVRKLGEGDRG